MRLSILSVSLLLGLASAGHTQEFAFIAPTANIPIGEDQTTATFTLGFDIAQTSSDSIAETQGFSMGVMHDSTVLTVEAIEYGSGVIDDEWGEPDFFSTNAYSDGWTAGAVHSFSGFWTVEFPEPAPVIDITYTAGEGSPLTEASSSPLTWSNSLGTPPVQNVVVVGGASLLPELVNGLITFEGASFIRGDMNGDGVLDIADIFITEDYLFLSGPTPPCLAAIDSNSDSQLDIADIVHLLNYLFVGGAEPGTPFPDCGPEPDGADLGCENYTCP